jgi:uncharacterized protein
LIDRLFDELPALMILGPRATGKSTTAARHARTIVRLDRAAEAAALVADPDTTLSALREPILLDEWQAVPEVLGAVKRSVDLDPSPARFLLTGSVRGDLDEQTWPGTGRVVRLSLWGLTVGEITGSRTIETPFIDRIATGAEIESPAEPTDLLGYVELALRGGFPQAALSTSDSVRERWLESYVDQLVTRDALGLGSGRDPDRLRRYFEGYAMNTAGVVADKTLLETANINRKTGVAYEQLLKNLFVVASLPAWSTNHMKRLVKSPKRCLADSSLLGALLRLDVQAVLRDGDLLGRLIETFVIAQVRSELEVCSTRPRMYHVRERNGHHEVDLLIELGGGRVIAIEIKATAAPKGNDARHLNWLREQIGDRFVAGIVFHTGPRVFSLGEQISAIPICALWQ